MMRTHGLARVRRSVAVAKDMVLVFNCTKLYICLRMKQPWTVGQRKIGGMLAKISQLKTRIVA